LNSKKGSLSAPEVDRSKEAITRVFAENRPSYERVEKAVAKGFMAMDEVIKVIEAHGVVCARINTSDCPPDFQVAFKHYVEAIFSMRSACKEIPAWMEVD